jgi:hypothetical protein
LHFPDVGEVKEDRDMGKDYWKSRKSQLIRIAFGELLHRMVLIVNLISDYSKYLELKILSVLTMKKW